ncbi:MAG: DUF444 family protein [candidate division WOR-3 bacterium]
MNTKWKYLRRLLKEKPNVSLDKTTKIPRLSLPRPLYIWEFDLGITTGSGPGSEDEGAVGRDEIVKYFLSEFQIPIIIEETSYEFDVRKEGKSKVGRISQLDLERTLRQKMRRLAIEGNLDPSSLFDTPFSDEDLVFNRFSIKETLSKKCLVVLGIDVSGSISDIERVIAKSLLIGLIQFFGTNFEMIDFYGVSHEVSAKIFGPLKIQKSENPLTILDSESANPIREFAKIQGGGGTSLYDFSVKVRNIANKYKNYSRYLFYAGDFSVFSNDLEIFEKTIFRGDPFHFYGIIVYDSENAFSTFSYIPSNSSILFMGREIAVSSNVDTVSVLNWIFKHLGKIGKFSYAQNR